MSRVTRRAKELRNRTRLRLPSFDLAERFASRRLPGAAIPMTLKVILLLLGALVITIGTTSAIDRRERTAEAAIEILDLGSFHSPGKGARGGVNVRYTFFVDGAAYGGSAFRPWSVAAAQGAKVCYDPRDPANHAVVVAEEICG